MSVIMPLTFPAKQLQNSERCRAFSSVDCFHILDHASTSFQLKVIHIQGSTRPTFFESTITSCKSKTILLILTLSPFMYIPLLLA